MKNITKLFLLALLLAFAPLAFAQQNLLTQTTLAAAVAGHIQGQGPSGSGPGTPAPVLVQVASATGIVGINPNLGVTASQPNQSAIYVDRELMTVIAVNGTTLTVTRGTNGTVAAPHASGAMVLVGKPYWFYAFDPGGTIAGPGPGISNVACLAANVVVSPWVNVRTGAQWLCSPTSNTWVPGFNNSLNPGNMGDMGTVASAAGAQTVLGPFFRISGTNAITSFTIPLGMNATAVGTASFCVYPTAAFTTTATNNIAAASTAVIGKTLCFTWNPSTSKFAASY